MPKKLISLWNWIVPLFEKYARQDLDFFAIRKTLKEYNFEKAKKDLVAGANVALLDFPQGMAYATIAGLPPQFGVYSSAVAATVGPWLSSSRFVMLGPTNATSVLVMSAFLTLPGELDRVAAIGILVLMVGIFLMIGSFIKLARLIQYVSQSVIVGYITAAALLIIANQLHTLLGFPIGDASTFFDVVGNTIKSIGSVYPPALMYGLLTVILYLVMSRHFKALPNAAITIVVVSCIHIIFDSSLLTPDVNQLTVACLNGVERGTIPFDIPNVSWQNIRQLASSAMAIAILSTIEGVSIGKSLAAREGDRLDVNQQMLSVGVANVACSFFHASPASGSLTRSVLNYSSGAKTCVSSIFSGLFVGLTILLMGPWIAYIPKAVLAAVVICVGFSLINMNHIRVALKSTREDAVVFIVTLLAGLLFPLDLAVYIGVGLSIVLFLGKVSSPQLVEYTFNDEGNLCELEHKEGRTNPHISIIHVEGELFFGASELFRDEIRRACADESLKIVILRLKNARHLDATSVMALEELIKFLRETDRHLIVSGALKEVYKVFKNSGLLDSLGRENFFMGSPRNPNVATRNALKRARHLLGGAKAEVRIFYDPSKDLNKSAG